MRFSRLRDSALDFQAFCPLPQARVPELNSYEAMLSSNYYKNEMTTSISTPVEGCIATRLHKVYEETPLGTRRALTRLEGLYVGSLNNWSGNQP